MLTCELMPRNKGVQTDVAYGHAADAGRYVALCQNLIATSKR